MIPKLLQCYFYAGRSSSSRAEVKANSTADGQICLPHLTFSVLSNSRPCRADHDDYLRSSFSPANLAPKSGTTTWVVAPGGVNTVTNGVDSKGRKTHSEYTAKFDGQDISWKGTIDGSLSPDQDAVAWKKVDDYTFELTNKLKGQVLTTQRTVISKDGKSRTNTITGKNAQGVTVNNTQFYEKQ